MVKNAALIHKSGWGCRIQFFTLAPQRLGSEIYRCASASGPIAL